MQFLTPLYLAGAALVALPVILHLLRRDVAPRVPFTAVRLLRGTPVDRTRNRRLRDLLLLAARVLALLLLAASFARPYRADAVGTNPLTIVAIDRSFSMGAPGVFERARALARTAIDEAGSGRVALVAFDDHADVLSPPGLGADARAALANVHASASGTRYPALFDKVTELASEEPGATLVVVSDLQRDGFGDEPASLPDGVRLVARDAGGARQNVALTDLRAEGTRAIATIRNYGPETVETAVRLVAGAQALPVQKVSVPPGSAVGAVFDNAPRSSWHATVVDPAGYAADNDRYAIVAGRALPRVLIVTGGPGSTSGFYLSRALLAGDGEGPDFDVRTVSGPTLSAMSEADVAHCAAIVVLSTHGLDRGAGEVFRRLLHAGGGVLIVAAPEVDAAVLSALFEWRPELTETDAPDAGVLAVGDMRHPIFRPFAALAANLAQVSVQRAWKISPSSPWRTLATYSGGGAALLERPERAGRILLFTSDLDRRWNDFPLHPSFVPFVQETARYLGAHRPEQTSWTVGDLPAGTPRVAGITTVRGLARAVNVDARESVVEHLSPEAFTEHVSRRASAPAAPQERRAERTESRQGLWRYGLALMLLTLVAEAFVGSR